MSGSSSVSPLGTRMPKSDGSSSYWFRLSSGEASTSLSVARSRCRTCSSAYNS